tara:strand:- start:348 stop:1991 length:1644 start_codon:yes stop_codon:yes gene_type:complete
MKKKILGGFVIVLLIVFGVGVPILEDKVSDQLQNKLGSNFYYDFEDLTISLWERELKLTNLSFAYPKDSSKFEYVGTANSFSVRGFDIISLLFSQSLELGSISLESPTLTTHISKKDNLNESSDSLKLEDLNFYSFIEGALDELQLEKFITTNGKFDWFYGTSDSLWRSIDGINLAINHFRLDSSIAADNNGWFKLDDVSLTVNHYTERLPDSIHSISSDSITLSYSKKLIDVKNLTMKPIYSRRELSRILTYQKDILTMDVSRLSMREIDVDRLIYQEELFVGEAMVKGLNLEVFKDKSLHFPHVYKELPIKMLMNMEFSLTVNKVIIEDADVSYVQQSKQGENTGEVAFNQINASIYNLTSSEKQLEINDHTKLEADALLHGKGQIDLTVDFDLLDTTGGHQVKGSVTSFNLSDLNKIIVPLTYIKIEEGFGHGLYFNFYANNYGTKGDIKFIYNNLSLKLLDKTAYQIGREEDRWLGSVLLNGFVVRKENPMGNLLRMGNIESDRNTEKSMFNLWWQGIASGMSSTMINFKKDSKEVDVSETRK